MIRRQNCAGPRYAFTLIELLVVIAIIAVLVALIVPAVMKVMDQMTVTRVRTEIGQLETALQSFSQDHNGVIPPSTLVLRENGNYQGDTTGTGIFLRRAFGKNIGPVDWNLNGQIDPNPIGLTGAQCLVFYLGGPGGLRGFCNSNVNPVATQGSPYYSFVVSRLVPDPTAGNNNSTPFPVYADLWPAARPYAYFSTAGRQGGYSIGDCSSIGAQPYYDSAPGNWVNPNTYQILSAGHNGVFGGQGSSTGAPWSSLSGTLDPYGKDDQANFSQRLLMAGNQ